MMFLLLVLLGLISHGSCQLRPGQKDRTRGTFLGHFETLEHDVGGAVWALDEEWLRVETFTYDGRGPDAFFWVGTEGDQPSPQGFLVPFPSNGSGGREMVLPAFHGSDVLFRMPDKLKVSDLRWISVWCRRFTVNFGSLLVPRNVELPMKRKISELSRLAHGVRSGNVTLLDAKTLYIPNLHYDGSAPDAFFWVGNGKPDRTGRKIPNEKQSTAVLGHYDGVDIELVLPDNLTLYDIDYLSIWCVTYRHNFGHVMIPAASELYLPPALGQTQVKAGSELQPIGSDPRNQYDVVDQVPDTTEGATTETGAGATEINTEATEAEATETGADATKAETTETGTEAKTETESTNTEAEAVTEVSVSESESKVTKSETETSKSESGSYSETEATQTETEATQTETEATQTATESKDPMLEAVTDISVSESESKVTKSETETTKSESGNYGDDENEIEVSRRVRMLNDTAEDLPTDPDLNYSEMDTNTTFASNYTEVEPEDLSSQANSNLTTNEFTFKYDHDPEVEPLPLNDSMQITEVMIHHKKNEYTFAVGDDDSIQHVVDPINRGNDFGEDGLVEIHFKKHSGAYFFAQPNGTAENMTAAVNGTEKGTEAQKEVEDLINPYHHHPKDIYSVRVELNTDDDKDKDDMSAPMSSSDRVSVPGGIYTSLLAVVGLSLMMWKIQ